jgi:DNA-directed RNA polymerase specialized sigma24 family protein
MLKAVSQPDFENFLTALDPNRERAAASYLRLRERLEKYFEWRDCGNPESLTDVVFDRTIQKIARGVDIENAEAFCISVAKFVLMEHRRAVSREQELADIAVAMSNDSAGSLEESRHQCLDKCLEQMPEEERQILVSYFDTDEQTYIRKRRQLSESMGLSANGLRIRISRLKAKLEKCLTKCLKEPESQAK